MSELLQLGSLFCVWLFGVAVYFLGGLFFFYAVSSDCGAAKWTSNNLSKESIFKARALFETEPKPMVQTMPVLRDTAGSESMSSRHMCSMKVSAMAA